MSNEKTLLCPAVNRDISSTECLVICDVVDHLLKLSVLKDLDVATHLDEESAATCRACEWHCR